MTDEAQPEDLRHQVGQLQTELRDLQQRVDSLSARLDGLAPQKSTTPQPAGSEAPAADSAETPSVHTPALITPGLAEAVRLVHTGQGEQAQRMLQSLPAEELAAQPAVVALVAAALCVQRGDPTAGLKALRRAKELTQDPRLLKAIRLVEQQAR